MFKRIRRRLVACLKLNTYVALSLHLLEYLVISALLLTTGAPLVPRFPWTVLFLGIPPYMMLCLGVALEAAEIFGLLGEEEEEEEEEEEQQQQQQGEAEAEADEGGGGLQEPLLLGEEIEEQRVDAEEDVEAAEEDSSPLPDSGGGGGEGAAAAIAAAATAAAEEEEEGGVEEKAKSKYRRQLRKINENFFNVNMTFVIVSAVYMLISLGDHEIQLLGEENGGDLDTWFGTAMDETLAAIFLVVFFAEFLEGFDDVSPEAVVALIVAPFLELKYSEDGLFNSEGTTVVALLLLLIPFLAFFISLPIFVSDTRVPVCGRRFPGGRIVYLPAIFLCSLFFMFLYPVWALLTTLLFATGAGINASGSAVDNRRCGIGGIRAILLKPLENNVITHHHELLMRGGKHWMRRYCSTCCCCPCGTLLLIFDLLRMVLCAGFAYFREHCSEGASEGKGNDTAAGSVGEKTNAGFNRGDLVTATNAEEGAEEGGGFGGGERREEEEEEGEEEEEEEEPNFSEQALLERLNHV
jgi:hypothetical protein